MIGIIKRKVRNAVYWWNVALRYLYIKIKCAPYYKYMLDQESKRIMKLRQSLSACPNIKSVEKFIKKFASDDMEFEISELDEEGEEKNIVLCLMEENAYAISWMNCTKVLLEHSKWRNSYRCVKLTDNFSVNDEDIIVPVYGKNLMVSSLKSKIGENIHVHVPPYMEILIGTVGKQYFDIFKPCKNEVIVDCGAYDGMTELEIAQWTNNTYKKIYAFEPNQANCQKCTQFYKDNALRDIVLIPKGTWSKDTILSFSVEEHEMSASGGIIQNGTEKVYVTTIDNVVGNDKVTFIKMDIEGSELEALKGAATTIKRDTPKLAICIYHKFEDLWTIPECILKLNNNYRFYIRHYTCHTIETVLYAVPAK